jgi:FdhD protein
MAEDISFDAIISPSDIDSFVYGNLLTEGFINSKDDIENYEEKEKGEVISVKIKIRNFDRKKFFMKRNYNIVWTECGSAPEIRRIGDKFEPFEIGFKIKALEIIKIQTEIKDKIDLFKQTGAFHYAFIFDKEIELKRFSYDVGRHNAVDKVVGKALLDGDRYDDKVLFVTGRISSDIVHKCLRAGIPVVVSKSAAMYTAISIARENNMCLIGFLRGKRFNVYSNEEVLDFS